MESEAELGSGHLSTSISLRRRSASVSDDYSVQKTNDDATESKYCAIQLNYWTDKFIVQFINASANSSNPVHHRDPEISRGYWARITAISSLISQFIKIAGPSAQIVNLGAGFDTLYWRLKDSGQKFYKYVEMDFSSVTAKKIRQIRKPFKQIDLVSYFSQQIVESQHSDLHAGDYQLIGVDLRQLHEFSSKIRIADLDVSQPTLFITECVLIYMDEQQSDDLLREIAKIFTTVSFINYEQVNMNDTFSKVMLENLNKRGILLPGLPYCENLVTQNKRFLSNGFTSVNSWTINDIYYNFFNQDEVKRIESLEPLDERELLTQLLEHYCLVYAAKDDTEQRAALANLIVR